MKEPKPSTSSTETRAERSELDVPAGERLELPRSISITVRGRRIALRGLKRPPKRWLRWLLILGPGMIAASAGNDAGGIATYSSTGAAYGYELIWVMVLITISLAVVQEICSRLGAASGRGLLDLIRERFGLGWGMFTVTVILVANGGLVISEFVGVGAAMEILGISRYLAVPLAAGLVWYLVVLGNYRQVEKVFLAMTLVFFAYPISVFLGHPHWGELARGAFVPTMHRDTAFLTLMVGLMGTTITPYMQLFQQSSIVERGTARKHYGPERIDAYTGSIFSNLMSISMIVATAATLHAVGQTQINSAADAAKALIPVAGRAASAIFATGLLGASLLAAAVLPLATAYAVCETFGLPKGVDLDFRRARGFFSIFTALIVLGAGVALIPNLPVIKLLIFIQVLNGVLLPFVLFLILRLANDKNIAGDLRNSRKANLIGWGTFGMVTVAVAVMLVLQTAGWLSG